MAGLDRALPASWYLDQAVFERERERVLYREWFCAGRADQVERPGSLALVDVAGESVLLVRTRAGELRAHYNVCRHRGSQVVPCPPAQPGGPQAAPARRAGSLRCPYHSWTYRLEGDLLRAPWSEEIDGFDQSAFGLHAVGVATWGGFVFLHLTPAEAAPLADQLGPVPERLRRYPLETLAVGHRLVYPVRANWKLVAENYNECYHCAGVHPELCRVVPAFKRGGSGLDWDRGIPHREGAWTFTASGRSDRAPFPGLDDDERTRHKGELVYPNLMLSLSADHVAAFTLWPHGPAHLRPLRRGRLLGPGQPPGLGDVRERLARHVLPGVHRRLVRPHGAAQPRHPPLRAGPRRGPRSRRVAGPAGRDGPAVAPRPLPAGPSWDVVVVGLGALGSAAAWALARAGARVLGLEQFELGHARGASHDHARVIRRSYHTPGYVRLAGLAYRAWAELEREAGERLVVTTGGLDLFPASSAIPPGPYRASLEACGVPYQWLDAAEVMRRWPAFRLDAGVHGLWQADGGMVPAARGTRRMQRLAATHGATLLDQAPVTAVRDLGGSIEVTAAGTTFRAGRLLLCTDAWTSDLLAQLDTSLPLVVTQEQFSYFRPADPAAFAPGRFPVWIWMDDPSFYGFPVWPGAALKAAQDVGGREVTAATRSFEPDPAASERLAGFLHARLPAAGSHDHTATCLYTLTPDRDLVLGPLPGHDRVLVALGAAHGFKFAPLLGRVLADLALHGGTEVDVAPFAPGRPALTVPGAPASYLV